MRRILFVALLAAVLVALNFLNRGLAGWHYVLSAPSGELLYVATFDAFNEEWTQYEGRLSSQVVDGALRLSVGEPIAGPYSVASPHFGDFDIRVETSAVEGPESNGFGIVFREQDPKNYYYFLIASDGYYQLNRVLEGTSEILSNWIASPDIHAAIGETNILRVVGQGNQFRFYINDERLLLCIPNDPAARSTMNPMTGECIDGAMLDTLTDSSFATGRLGVVAMTIPGQDLGVVVDFDNVLVYAP